MNKHRIARELLKLAKELQGDDISMEQRRELAGDVAFEMGKAIDALENNEYADARLGVMSAEDILITFVPRNHWSIKLTSSLAKEILSLARDVRKRKQGILSQLKRARTELA